MIYSEPNQPIKQEATIVVQNEGNYDITQLPRKELKDS